MKNRPSRSCARWELLLPAAALLTTAAAGSADLASLCAAQGMALSYTDNASEQNAGSEVTPGNGTQPYCGAAKVDYGGRGHVDLYPIDRDTLTVGTQKTGAVDTNAVSNTPIVETPPQAGPVSAVALSTETSAKPTGQISGCGGTQVDLLDPAEHEAPRLLTHAPATDPGPQRAPASPPALTGEHPPSAPLPEAPATSTVALPVEPPASGAPPVTAIANTAQPSLAAADNARGIEIVDMAVAQREAVNQAAQADQQTLAQPYRAIGPDEWADRLSRAQDTLSQDASLIETASSSTLDAGEQARFQNYTRNAIDKTQEGLSALHQAQDPAHPLGDNSPFSGFLGTDDGSVLGSGLSKIAALSRFFGVDPSPAPGQATRADGLVNRMILLGGLPPEDRQQALKQLKLVEHPQFTTAQGARLSLNLLHNGYLMGGGATAMDCSSFVSQVLPTDMRRGRFTTQDFRVMWIYGRTRRLPKPPTYSASHAKQVVGAADGFVPIDVYAGEPLAVGDILVYRLADDPVGHVVIVQSYNPLTMRAEIIEAAQSAGTLRSRTFNLSADPLGARRRLLIPGLWDLRLKPVSNQACVYREPGRAPSVQKTGGSP